MLLPGYSHTYCCGIFEFIKSFHNDIIYVIIFLIVLYIALRLGVG